MRVNPPPADTGDTISPGCASLVIATPLNGARITVEGVYVAAPSKNKDAAYDFAKVVTDVRASGRAGHWGLPGMRERVDRFGGKLDFWSEAGAGTEAVLTVPAAAAYANSNGGRFSFLRRKKARA